MKKIISINFVFDTDGFSLDIRQKREDADLTQHEVAVMLDVHHTTVGKWETGIGYPCMKNFMNICNLYDLNPTRYFLLSDGYRPELRGDIPF